MDTNDLLNVWKDYHQNLDGQLRVNGALLKDASLRKVKSLLSEFKGTSIFELIANGLFIIFLNRFIFDHFFEYKFSIPAGLLLIMMIAGVAINIFKLSELRKINYQTPVIETQKRLERLKLIDLQETNLLYIAIPIFSSAFLIVFVKALMGMDLYLVLGIGLVWYVVGSVIVGVIITLLLKRFPDKKIEKAIDFLGEISMFEKN